VVVKQLVIGAIASNAYVVAPEGSESAAIIDPGAEPKRIIDAVGDLRPAYIMITHGHGDHIAAVADVAKAFPEAQVVAGRDERIILADPFKNMSAMMMRPCRVTDVSLEVSEGDEISLDTLVFRVLETPGHTPGSVCFYVPDDGEEGGAVFTGDALFAGGVGRTDFLGGNSTQLMESIHNKLLVLPEDTTVWPGHGETTTIGVEKSTHPFLVGA